MSNYIIGALIGWILGIILVRYYLLPKLGLFKKEVDNKLTWEELEPMFKKTEKRLGLIK